MQLVRDDNYQRKERRFFKYHQNLIGKYAEVLKKLQLNPFDSSLKTHKLKGDLKEFYACSLTHEYRIIFIFLIQNEQIVLVDIGSHDEVY
ncbi:MAG: type II toxin-antitoxin system mRNA interferase toxin, RelE/StbE family [Methylococcales bacterium]|nr:type II toxin-antitoxin system mRNA interferase toxin, RelE/StbE family [Methylococcales bacterium]